MNYKNSMQSIAFIILLSVSFLSCNKGDVTPDNETGTLIDIDGNKYNTVKIGKQVWMAENLKTTKYNNGDIIPIVESGNDWSLLSDAGMCQYANSESMFDIFGGLYNGYVIIDERNVCPNGWHVPTNEEWLEMEEFLGGSDIAGGKLKQAGTEHWQSPNTGADNSSGFTALPGTSREAGGSWDESGTGYTALFWTSTKFENAYESGLLSKDIYYEEIDVLTGGDEINRGCSVRCIKD
ncbi:fibrobacter succinogenes major paralogous domain-containing protein [Carboxylicivirga mesophila]|uniref:Fibrobacter succinogenes major paralogous domain-containing protein n=1 Tax=Carboxylicivirga mesophila TaxID=1166478 RepID=A0ABS5KB68_9BACT|nr:fibrobacter succinogenes major paralogous domain-containing protein [Carboxylicivirga mesophila]MBS2212226.1 fibrobacter succinogenes major paralogous domain-containing protein [Carboxylicivirga mesophila]